MFLQQVVSTYASSVSTANIGIGINSTTAPSGSVGLNQATNGTTTGTVGTTVKADAILLPTIGINNFNTIEQATAGTTNNQFNGATSMRMTLEWMG